MPRTPSDVARFPTASAKATLPGGKALLRQLQWLTSRGMIASAEDAVRSSVPSSLWSSFQEQIPALAPHEEIAPWRFSLKERQAYTRAAHDAHASISKAGASLSKWRSLGPSTITNGQTYGKGPNGEPVVVNVSGRVSAIAVDPTDASHLLCGAAKGGVWEKRGDQEWVPRTDSASTLQVGALCFDLSNPTIAYCGTGEGNDDAASIGHGILASRDGGSTWDILCDEPFLGEGFFDLQVDPGDGKRLFAATTHGLRISTFTDSRLQWSQPRQGSCVQNACWSVAIHPAGGSDAEILAACADGLWRSTDGNAWQRIDLPEAPSASSKICFVRLAVVIAPSDPRIAYAWGAWDAIDSITASPQRKACLWRRDAGVWKALPDVKAAEAENLGQADYDWCLGISPYSESEVYCGGFSLYRGTISEGAWTWINISSQGPGSSIHPDQHVVAFGKESPPALYAGCDGGLFMSRDRGDSWKHLNDGLVITQFEYLALSPANADWFIGGTQDNGTNLWLNSDTWQQVEGGDGGRCAVRQDQPTIVFHTFYGLELWRSDSAGYAPWLPVFSRPYDPSQPESLFYPPFACSAEGGDTMALGADEVIYVYRDGGPWVGLPIPNPTSGSASVVTIPNRDELWVGTTDGRLFVAKWRGASWRVAGEPELQEINLPRGRGYWISDILADASRIWVTYSSVGGPRVFYSSDQGVQWADITGNLPQLPVNTIQVDPADPNRFWVGLDMGVFEGHMKDQSVNWTPYCNGLPNVIVGDLVFHKATRRLRAGTQSRGAWELQV